jgi:hypothetical protein
MSPVERETHRLTFLDTIQIALRSRSPSAQANAGRIRCHSGDHSANAAVTQNEDQMAESTIGALANMATAITADRGVVEALTQTNSCLAKQLEDNSSGLRELKAFINKERREKRGQRSFNPSASTYYCTHGYKVGSTHTSLTCKLPSPATNGGNSSR